MPAIADTETAERHAHRRRADLRRLLRAAQGEDYLKFYKLQDAFRTLHGYPRCIRDGQIAAVIYGLDVNKHSKARDRVDRVIEAKVRAIRKLLRDAAKRRAAKSSDPPAEEAA